MAPEQKIKELRPRTNRNFKTQGVDLAYQQTGISEVGYCWTTQQKYFPAEKKTYKILSKKLNPKKYPPKTWFI